jgi:hypothetical protein
MTAALDNEIWLITDNKLLSGLVQNIGRFDLLKLCREVEITQPMFWA